MKCFRGKTALVTGASSGIGEQLARQLAAAGCHLILVARRRERLDALAGELSMVTVDVLPTDLSQPQAPQQLLRQVDALGRQVDVLINNAGFGYQKPLLELSLEEQLGMVDVNVRSVLALTQLFAEGMAERGQGWILQVGSIASYVPIPGMSTYSATKAFVLNLGRALHDELKPRGITVTTLCPGGTRTEFSSIARQQIDPNLEWAMMAADRVAADGLQALVAGRSVVVPGALYKTAIQSLRLTPEGLVTRLSAMVMGRNR
ncbi:MAG: SDR family oxidoreductase [Alcanivorax sp.]|nr:SDR family oxidoreductase [Alcanivorax sp.]